MTSTGRMSLRALRAGETSDCWEADELNLVEGVEAREVSTTTQELVVPAAPPPNFFLPLEKAL